MLTDSKSKISIAVFQALTDQEEQLGKARVQRYGVKQRVWRQARNWQQTTIVKNLTFKV